MSWALVVIGSHCCSSSALYIWKNNIVRAAILIQYQLYIMKQSSNSSFLWSLESFQSYGDGERQTPSLPYWRFIAFKSVFLKVLFGHCLNFYHFYSYIRTKQKTKEIIITAMIFFKKISTVPMSWSPLS